MKLMKVTVAAVVAAAGVNANAATPLLAGNVASYELNNTFADQLGGASLSGNGGVFSGSAIPNGLNFGVNEGPTLNAGALTNTNTYSIELIFSLADVANYNKIIDFSNRTSDPGLYILNGALNFYPSATGGSVIQNNEIAQVVLTNSAGLVQGYLDGALQFSFNDTNEYARIGTALHFFRDDSSVGGEASSGFVDGIRLYNRALTASEIVGLYNGGNFQRVAASSAAVPEPSTWLMMILGFAAVGFGMRRKQRQTVRLNFA
jgi:hypothetical protein